MINKKIQIVMFLVIFHGSLAMESFKQSLPSEYKDIIPYLQKYYFSKFGYKIFSPSTDHCYLLSTLHLAKNISHQPTQNVMLVSETLPTLLEAHRQSGKSEVLSRAFQIQPNAIANAKYLYYKTENHVWICPDQIDILDTLYIDGPNQNGLIVIAEHDYDYEGHACLKTMFIDKNIPQAQYTLQATPIQKSFSHTASLALALSKTENIYALALLALNKKPKKHLEASIHFFKDFQETGSLIYNTNIQSGNNAPAAFTKLAFIPTIHNTILALDEKGNVWAVHNKNNEISIKQQKGLNNIIDLAINQHYPKFMLFIKKENPIAQSNTIPTFGLYLGDLTKFKYILVGHLKPLESHLQPKITDQKGIALSWATMSRNLVDLFNNFPLYRRFLKFLKPHLYFDQNSVEIINDTEILGPIMYHSGTLDIIPTTTETLDIQITNSTIKL